jgi:hypothetical protein
MLLSSILNSVLKPLTNSSAPPAQRENQSPQAAGNNSPNMRRPSEEGSSSEGDQVPITQYYNDTKRVLYEPLLQSLIADSLSGRETSALTVALSNKQRGSSEVAELKSQIEAKKQINNKLMLNDQFGELSARRFMTQLNNIGGIQVSTVQSAQPSGFYSGSNIRLDGLSETNKEKLEASLNLHVRHYQ